MSLTELTKIGKNLKITLTPEGYSHLCDVDRNDLRAWNQTLVDLIESHLCNGWERLRPEEIGALTDCDLIISDDVDRDDSGVLTRVGRVYWNPDYQVSDPLDTLCETRDLTLIGVGD